MQKALAQAFSYLFHPLWMPLLVFLVADYLDPNLVPIPELKRFIIICLAVNIVAPAIGVFIMMKRGSISDVNIHKQSERSAPYVLVIFYYLCTYFIFRSNDLPLSSSFMSMLLAVPVSLGLALLINFKWKISVHMLAQGGLAGVLWALGLVHSAPIIWALIGALIIAGFVGFSRSKLRAHTHAQIYAGFLLGLAVNFIIIRFGLVL
jgi:hypothetical protein